MTRVHFHEMELNGLKVRVKLLFERALFIE